MVAKISSTPKFSPLTPAVTGAAHPTQSSQVPATLHAGDGYMASAYSGADRASVAGKTLLGAVTLSLNAQQMAAVTKVPLTEQQMQRLFQAGERLQAAATVLQKNPNDARAKVTQAAANKDIDETLNQVARQDSQGAIAAQRFAMPNYSHNKLYRHTSGHQTMVITRYRRIW